MDLRPLGKSGLQVPAIGMGTWKSFDAHGEAAEAERRIIVQTAIDAGTTLFDTSPMYGESERVLAKAVENRRDDVMIADKIWTASAKDARQQVQKALHWYDGRIDIYQIHNLVAWREHLPVLEDLRASHAVTVIGATHYQHSAFKELMEVMRTGRIQMIQIPYNAVDHMSARDVLPLAEEFGLGVLVMEPLGSGKLLASQPSPAVLKPLAQFGIRTWAQALLKWILSDSRVHCVIPATSKPQRAAENAAAGEPPWFDHDTRDYVSRLARTI